MYTRVLVLSSDISEEGVKSAMSRVVKPSNGFFDVFGGTVTSPIL